MGGTAPANQLRLSFTGSADGEAETETCRVAKLLWRTTTRTSGPQGLNLLNRRMRTDPAFPEAHAALDITEEFIGDEVSLTPATEYQRAIAEARRALDLDPSLAEAHVALGNAMLRNEWDWHDVKVAYLRALDLDDKSVSALKAYARLLGAIGKKEESLRVIGRAQALDPLSFRIQYDRAVLSYLARDYEQAVAQLTSLLEVHPEFAEARKLLSDAYARDEHWDKASTELLKWLQPIRIIYRISFIKEKTCLKTSMNAGFSQNPAFPFGEPNITPICVR
jgi:tetratricopeptide (TPR) repeat protein